MKHILSAFNWWFSYKETHMSHIECLLQELSSRLLGKRRWMQIKSLWIWDWGLSLKEQIDKVEEKRKLQQAVEFDGKYMDNCKERDFGTSWKYWWR